MVNDMEKEKQKMTDIIIFEEGKQKMDDNNDVQKDKPKIEDIDHIAKGKRKWADVTDEEKEKGKKIGRREGYGTRRCVPQ